MRGIHYLPTFFYLRSLSFHIIDFFRSSLDSKDGSQLSSFLHTSLLAVGAVEADIVETLDDSVASSGDIVTLKSLKRKGPNFL